MNNNVPAFLLKTYEILESASHCDTIGWDTEGTTFTVKHVNKFSEDILPIYFKHNNFASFARQLNMYEFHKARNQQNQIVFKHKLFLRGQIALVCQMRRKTGESPCCPLAPPDCDYNELVMEMAVLANKQSELESMITKLIIKNDEHQIENKYLWKELLKQRNEIDSQQEGILVWFLQESSKAPSFILNTQQIRLKRLLRKLNVNVEDKLYLGLLESLKTQQQPHIHIDEFII